MLLVSCVMMFSIKAPFGFPISSRRSEFRLNGNSVCFQRSNDGGYSILSLPNRE